MRYSQNITKRFQVTLLLNLNIEREIYIKYTNIDTKRTIPFQNRSRYIVIFENRQNYKYSKSRKRMGGEIWTEKKKKKKKEGKRIFE